LKRIKEQYGAVAIGFSGWAADPRYRYTMGVDYAMPFSDHCDYVELVEAVRQCNPEKVYTFHGFAAEFAGSLKKMGFDAQPIEKTKKGSAPTLDSFS
jgi:putative mRNA 3-end processing factor